MQALVDHMAPIQAVPSHELVRIVGPVDNTYAGDGQILASCCRDEHDAIDLFASLGAKKKQQGWILQNDAVVFLPRRPA